MGFAAYNRGTKLVCRLIDDTMRNPVFEIMEQLNAVPKHPDAARPFGPIQFVSHQKGWLAECPINGYGFYYPTLRESVSAWKVTVTSCNNGVFIGEPA